MLNELLPGVREVRTPLATGYIWIFFIWLIWGRSLPDAVTATGLLKDLYGAVHALNPVAIGIAASFMAYLVGCLSTTLSDISVDRLNSYTSLEARLKRAMRRRRNSQDPDRLNGKIRALYQKREKSPVQNRLREALHIRLEPHREAIAKHVYENTSSYRISKLRSRFRHPSRSHYLRNLSGDFDADFVEAIEQLIVDDYVEDLNRDLTLVPARLLGNDPELYSAYDRLQAEAQFRIAISLPISFVITALAIINHPIWLALLVLPVALFLTGMQRRSESAGILAEAILVGRVESPVFARFEKLTQESLLDLATNDDGSNSDDAYVPFKDSLGFMVDSRDSD
ncbi:hypothetical protein [Microtetraspora fusca]|uniref:hypothetical protein n=1 Tax=Microtetraspora fusca TaxID=1997 RepID=UPI000B1D2897|nr:hypothetical protein [Microtetraspora fusca]